MMGPGHIDVVLAGLDEGVQGAVLGAPRDDVPPQVGIRIEGEGCGGAAGPMARGAVGGDDGFNVRVIGVGGAGGEGPAGFEEFILLPVVEPTGGGEGDGVSGRGGEPGGGCKNELVGAGPGKGAGGRGGQGKGPFDDLGLDGAVKEEGDVRTAGNFLLAGLRGGEADFPDLGGAPQAVVGAVRLAR